MADFVLFYWSYFTLDVICGLPIGEYLKKKREGGGAGTNTSKGKLGNNKRESSENQKRGSWTTRKENTRKPQRESGELIKKGKARQFHVGIWPLNQQSSDLKRWEKIPETDEVEVAYKVEKYKLFYEPIYVSRGDIPAFDERFIGFGYTRNSQVKDINQWCLVSSQIACRCTRCGCLATICSF